MTLIRLETMIDALGGPALADGKIVATSSAPRADGPVQVLPARVVVQIINGIPSMPLNLEPSGGTWYWTIEVVASKPKASVVRDVSVPDVEEIDWNDLPDIDPATVQPLPVVPPSIAELIDQAEELLEQVTRRTVTATVNPANPLTLILEYPAFIEHPTIPHALVMPLETAS